MAIEYQGMIIWLTGAHGARRTTIAHLLEQKLRSCGAKTEFLDSDKFLPSGYDNTNVFSKDDQIRYMEIVANIASTLKKYGIICIVVTTIPYENIKAEILNRIDAIEVYVDASMEESKNFANLDDTHEPFLTPQIHLRTEQESDEELCQRIYDFLVMRGYIDEIEGYLDSVYTANPLEKLLGKFPFSSLLLLKSMAKKSLRKGIVCFLDDCMQFFRLRRYTYTHRIIFVAGLPKSGTTWLQNMLGMIPGYHVRPVYDPSRAPLFHDVSPMVFDLMPSYTYSVIKLHTKYTDYNFETLVSKVSKFIVLYRDLRDMCVSRYFHVLNQEDHRHNKLYHTLSQEDSLFHCINIIKNEYVDWVQRWYEVAKNNSNILQIRYEDLNTNLLETMKSVLAFLDIPDNEDLLKRMEKTQLKKEVDLKESLAKGTTKRRGVVGDWKNYFNEDHKSYFKKIAGDLLVNLGYEKDLNW